MSDCMKASFDAIFSDPERDRMKPYACHLGVIYDLIHQTCVENGDRVGNDEAFGEAWRRLHRAHRLKSREIRDVPACSRHSDQGSGGGAS